MSGQLHTLAALPQEKGHGTYRIEGSIGPRASLDALGRAKFLACTRNWTTIYWPSSP